MVNYTVAHTKINYMAEAVISSPYGVVDWRSSASAVNLDDGDAPRVLASSGKLTGALEKEMIDLNSGKTNIDVQKLSIMQNKGSI